MCVYVYMYVCKSALRHMYVRICTYMPDLDVQAVAVAAEVS